MATLNPNALTLLEHAKRRDPDGKPALIAELLSQTNEILTDATFIEGNGITSHRCTIRTGLPDTFFKILNVGTPPSKSTTAQVDEAMGILEAWSEVDKDLAMLNGDTAAFRMGEAQAFIESMNQRAASTMFYGNQSLNPEQFNGLSVRYNDLSAPSAQNIVNAGGAGTDNSSIWLVCWGPQTVHGIFPKGSPAGLHHYDHGEQTIETTTGIAGSRLRAYQDQWKWKLGLSVKDWRYAVRIPNISTAALQGGTPPDLINLMIKAIHRLPTRAMGKCAFYMNRTVHQYLDIQKRDDVAAAGMTYKEVDGKMVMGFRGVDIRTVDALLETEAAVV